MERYVIKRLADDGTFNDTQHLVRVRLIVKGTSRAAALKTIEDNLMDWFHETGNGHTIPSYGYPNGSLLHYTIED